MALLETEALKAVSLADDVGVLDGLPLDSTRAPKLASAVAVDDDDVEDKDWQRLADTDWHVADTQTKDWEMQP